METHDCVAAVSVATTCDNIHQWLERFHTFMTWFSLDFMFDIIEMNILNKLFSTMNMKNKYTLHYSETWVFTSAPDAQSLICIWNIYIIW